MPPLCIHVHVKKQNITLCLPRPPRQCELNLLLNAQAAAVGDPFARGPRSRLARQSQTGVPQRERVVHG